MYDFHLTDQVRDLVKAGIINEKDSDKALTVLKNYWADRIAITWNLEDVLGRAEERGINITKEKAQGILHRMLDKHDASIGVSWTTIDCYLED